MYKVIISYYDKNGNHKNKTIARQTKNGLEKALTKAIDELDFIDIERVSPNLVEDEFINSIERRY